jgi:hypothetical protein
LEEIGEPPLSCASSEQGAEVYRVYEKPALASAHWSYRLERTHAGAELHVARFYPRTADELFVEKRKTIPVSEADFQKFRTAFAEARFWEQSTTYEPSEDDWAKMTTDGSMLLIEGMASGRYHGIERESDFLGSCEVLVTILEELRGPVTYVNGRHRW